MIITINQHGFEGVPITVTVRNLDDERTPSTEDIPSVPTNAPGEYRFDATEPVGDYHLSLYADGNLIATSYLKIISDTAYSLVAGYDDLGREPTASEIESELGDGSHLPTKKPKVLG